MERQISDFVFKMILFIVFLMLGLYVTAFIACISCAVRACGSYICISTQIRRIFADPCKDHIHMLVSIPPKMSVSRAMGILKGKSALMIFDRFANLKYKYGNRHFWCGGYFVDTVGRNKTAIQKYIQNQVEEDQMVEQLSMKEYIDPFMGTPAKEGK